jgi:hypothetical protein
MTIQHDSENRFGGIKRSKLLSRINDNERLRGIQPEPFFD